MTFQFYGPANDKGTRPLYAIFARKGGAFEIHKWVQPKKKPGYFGFYKATGTLEQTAERMLTLCVGDVLATDVETLINTWKSTSMALTHALGVLVGQTED